MSEQASELAQRIFERVCRPESQLPPWATDEPSRRLVQPGQGYLGIREVVGAALGEPSVRLSDLRSLPGGEVGRRLVALRYFIENADIWLEYFTWRTSLARLPEGAEVDRVTEVQALATRVRAIRARAPKLDGAALDRLASDASPLFGDDPSSDDALEALVALGLDPDARAGLRTRLRARAPGLFADTPSRLDRLYLASMELDRYPATSVSAGSLRYVLVADKGEMGVRAVREAAALGLVPVALHSLQDDASALQVRLARQLGGFAIGLSGTFRESYASFRQITDRVLQTFRRRFGDDWEAELSRAALYPGYGPLAENAAAIRCFRRHGVVFAGPMQDVVEHAGDKRRFRAIVESIDPKAVTPGIVIADTDAATIRARVLEAHARGDFRFPGRLKAANGGGGRGQAVVPAVEALDAAITKVLGEIEANAWDPGVMFEQNIDRTVHLEVQILRDRYGNARHFGMRDCTEQRASQKIQPESLAHLRAHPTLAERGAIARADDEQGGHVEATEVVHDRLREDHVRRQRRHVGERLAVGALGPAHLQLRERVVLRLPAPIEVALPHVVAHRLGRLLQLGLVERLHRRVRHDGLPVLEADRVHEHQALGALGEHQREARREHPAHRVAHHGDPIDLERVEQRARLRGHGRE